MKKRIFQKILKNPLSCFGLFLLAALLFIAVFADFLSPYHFDKDNRSMPFRPPTEIHFWDVKGNFHPWPFVYAENLEFNKYFQHVYYEDTSKTYPIQFFVKGDSYKFWGLFEWDRHLFGVQVPAKLHLFGTDGRGRDLLSRILVGSRISLSIGIVGILISIILGTFIGGISGYFGGKTDHFLMRLAEVFMMVPTFYLLLAIRSSLPLGVDSLTIYFLITYILGLVGWAPLARVIRGMVLSIKEQDFVLAARLVGTSHFKIIANHILPHTFSYLIVVVAIALPGYLVAESALSLLGLGIQEPYVSWGMLLKDALSITQLKFHFWILAPAAFIFITVLAFNLIGDRLRDILDPTESGK